MNIKRRAFAPVMALIVLLSLFGCNDAAEPNSTADVGAIPMLTAAIASTPTATAIPTAAPTVQPTLAPTPEPTPVPQPVPVAVKPANHSGRTTHALVGNHWIYMGNQNEVYSIPLDAPEGTQPKLLWEQNGFPFFLVWQNDVYIFAYPPNGSPMRGIRINPETGEYRVYDMRQKYFYFPSWTNGNLAYGVGLNSSETRILNGDTEETSVMQSEVWWYGASDHHFFFASYGYAEPNVRDAKNPTGPALQVAAPYEFISSIGDGAIVRVNDDLVLVRENDARLLFTYMPSSRAYSPFLYDSFTPHSELFPLDTASEAKDVLGNSYSGAVYVTPEGVMSVNPNEFTNRPASQKGGAAIFPSANAGEIIPIEDFPLYDFFVQK